MRSRKQLHNESGSALVAGIIILFIILGFGLAALSTADVQSHQTGHEASGEAAFNTAEAALDAEANLLEQSWPSSATSACNQGSAPSTFCPGTSVTSSLSTTYAGNWYSNAQWSLQILDDSSPESANYYVDQGTSGVPTYDANNDNKVWIRAQANVGGQQRIVVAEMVRQSSVVSLPRSTIVSGGVSTSNQGNKIIIETVDAAGSGFAGPVDIRCNPQSSPPASGDPCTGWNSSKGQLDPSGNYQTGYVDPNTSTPYQTLPSTTLANLKRTAIAEGTYFNGSCPTSWSGLIYIDNPPGGTCNGGGNTNNSPPLSTDTPGMIIMSSGTLNFNGNPNYYGIIYMMNSNGTTPTSGPCTAAQQDGPMVTVHGNTHVYGAIFVDKCGTVDGGSSKLNVTYDSLSFGAAQAFSVPMLAKNTFRIISNS